MKTQNVYAMEESAVLSALSVGKEGLSDAEAARRLEEHGKNALTPPKKKSLLLKFLAQFKDIMIIVLLCAAAVSAAIAIAEKKPTELIDSGIILLIVIVNAVIGLIQENKAEAAMESLKKMNRPYAKVVRNGETIRIPSEDVTVGDIVRLDAGDTVPADMRLLESASLKIEESALTGESVPTEKDALAAVKDGAPLGDRVNMAYSGGTVTYGRGIGVVVATGMNTEVGKIATMLSEETANASPLQKQLATTAKMLSVLVLGIAAVIFAVTVIRDHTSPDAIVGAFMTAVSIAVAAIPEGLPAVVTIVLALGVRKMSERNAIVKNLASVETLGCCEIICSDKTGTLTLNRMTVRAMYYDGNIHTSDEAKKDSRADYLARTLALCNDTEDGEHGLVGDPTETALVQFLKDAGGNYAALTAAYPRVDELPFDSVRKLMTTVNEHEGQRTAYVKGAPDILLSRCDFIMTAEGVRPMEESDRAAVLAANKEMADTALRVLAAAVKTEDLDNKALLETGLVFVGLVGMIDPPREEVKAAVATCREAGIRPIMITGDHKDTAAAIAREIGILDRDHKVMEGVEIDRYSDEEFVKIVQQYSVFARVSPENKVKIVHAYKTLGKIVAMTGDGVNDAPSIKSADIGIGMGITGTDVSKGAADMVLADDNFATIVGAVEEGRKIFANIKKAIQYLLSANIAEVLSLFIVSVFFAQDFLTPVMILWINLVTDSLPALSLGVEAAEKNVMHDKPRRADGSLFRGETGIAILVQGAMQTACVLLSYFVGLSLGGPGHHAVAMTMAFITLALIQLFHAYNMKSFRESLFNGKILQNRYLNWSFVIGLALVLFAVLIPGVNTMFGAEMLTGTEWLIAVGASVLIVPMVELYKFILRRVQKQ